MLSDADLTAMRATLTASLPDTATIQRATRSSDSKGGTLTSWATAATTTGLIGAARQANETPFAGKVNAHVMYPIAVPQGTDVRASDRIVIGSRTFEVVGVEVESYELRRVAWCAETG